MNELINYVAQLNGYDDTSKFPKPLQDMTLPKKPAIIGAVPQRPAIVIPEEIADSWFAALESGKYEQCNGKLAGTNSTTGNVGYCCLGVLQKIVSGEVENSEGDPHTLPSEEWLAKYGIEFFSMSNELCENPNFVVRADGDDYVTNAAALNDAGFTFKEISSILKTVTKKY
jgi:hypothetical protein